MATPPPSFDPRAGRSGPRQGHTAGVSLFAAVTLIAFGVLAPGTPGANTGARVRPRRGSTAATLAAAIGGARSRTGQRGPSAPTGPTAARGPTATSNASGATGPTATAGPTGPPAPAPLVRYRVTGCRRQGNVAYRSGPRRREVAIGFDDGPARDTPAFVRMLERSRVQATFFMIGRQVTAANKGTLLRELRAGDVLGDHTFTHPYLPGFGDVRGQLESTIRVIRSLTGYTPCVFRPPFGAYDGSIVRIARSLGLATVLWNVDPSDWAQPGVSAISQRVLAQVQPGSIILSHDGGGPRGQTLAAYPPIIAGLRARGYRIVTIPQLLGFRPVYAPCSGRCDGIGLPRAELPRSAILEGTPRR